MPKVALATCLQLPEHDVDQELMLKRFNAAGLETSLAAWDDRQVDWSGFDAVVVRSTWDYPEHPEAFRQWIDTVNSQTLLLNPAETMKANIDKRYLFDLEKKGIRIVPTQLAPTVSSDCYAEWQFEKIVVKPHIGAGSWMTKVFGPNDLEETRRHISEIEQQGTLALVQPYMHAVETGGERSLIWIDGAFTHKIVKQPRFDGQDESVSEAQELDTRDIEEGSKVAATLASDVLYARIDFIVQDSTYYLSELELIEPSLFFLLNPAALDRLIEGVKKRL